MQTSSATIRNALILTLCCGLLMAAEADRVVVEERPVTGTAVHRGRSVAEEQALLTNPVAWRTIDEVVPDGSVVAAGDVVALWDAISLERELAGQLLQKAIDDLRVERDLADIDNRLTGIRDNIDDLEGRLAVSEARLATLEALPLQVEVTLAEGRLRLAEMEHEAAAADHEQALDRRRRKLIGAGEVARLEAEAAIAAARLDHARTLLAEAREPADPLEREQAQLEIANLRLELDKVRSTYEKRQGIAELQQANARRRNERIERRIEETREKLGKLRVTAPTDGYALYTRRFKRALSENGGKLWRNHQFMRIPDASTVVFKTVVPEYQRPWFAKGDPVTIAVPGAANLRLPGHIKRIGDMPRDREDDDEGQWGAHDARSGVKVYDLTVVAEELPDRVRPGLNVLLELEGRQAFTAPSVPLTFVRYRDGVPHLAVEGVEQPVKGQAIDGRFVIEDDSIPTGTVVHRHGKRSQTAQPQIDNRQPQGDHLRLSGEIIPTDTVDVRIGRIHWHGSKITWLIEEGTRVAAGDTVATLDDDEIDKEIRKQENNVDGSRNSVETEAEELHLLREESAVRRQRMHNELRQAEIAHELATGRIDRATLSAARRDEAIADIRLAEAERQLTNLRGRDQDLVSGSELTRQERQVQRMRLQLEKTRLRRQAIEAGPDEAERRKADLALLRNRLKASTTEEQIAYELAKRERSWRRAEVRLQRGERWLNELKRRRENLTVQAPATGLVQYNLIRGSDGLSKVQKGASVRSRYRILKIADTSEMAVRVAVPEAYYTRLQEGMRVRARAEDLPEIEGHVSRIEYVFEPKRRNDSDLGLYSQREPSGETIFYTHVDLAPPPGTELKPGAMVEVTFPFSASLESIPADRPHDHSETAADRAIAEHRR